MILVLNDSEVQLKCYLVFTLSNMVNFIDLNFVFNLIFSYLLL
jgi:hypothetical protein